MRDSDKDGLGEALAAAEAAPPVESVDVIAASLRRQLGARSVSFLITDFTGASVVRLGTADDIDLERSADPIAVSGTVYDEVIRTQRPHVEAVEGGTWTRVIAPVTNRGDALGLLELLLPQYPGEDTLLRISRSAHALAYIIIANRPFTDLYQWGRLYLPAGPGRRDPAPAAAHVAGLRGGPVRGRRGLGSRPSMSAATPSTTS